MVTLQRTDSSNPDFVALVQLLDADLAIRDGDEHGFYDQFNKVTAIKYVIVAYIGGVAVGCGAIKELTAGAMEIKRMYTLPEYRGRGVARTVLEELEQWAALLGYGTCMLETGKKQPEAIALYIRCGYIVVPNYGQYAGVENSVCFQKNVSVI